MAKRGKSLTSSGAVSPASAADKPQFVDLFAGCGGLSLGLLSAGWRGLFAVEQDALAFETLRHNLIGRTNNRLRYAWPEWLDQSPAEISQFIKQHKKRLAALRGQVIL